MERGKLKMCYELECYEVSYLLNGVPCKRPFDEEEDAIDFAKELVSRGHEVVGIQQILNLVGWL